MSTPLPHPLVSAALAKEWDDMTDPTTPEVLNCQACGWNVPNGFQSRYCGGCGQDMIRAEIALARPSPQPAVIDQIGKLLDKDPLGGGVTQHTIEAIAAIVSPSPQATDWRCVECKAITTLEHSEPERCFSCGCKTFARCIPAEPRVPSEADVRPEVAAFALVMERELRANDHKPGWQGDSFGALADRVRDEAGELSKAVVELERQVIWAEEPSYGSRGGNGWSRLNPATNRREVGVGYREMEGDERRDQLEAIESEAADVANMAMMVADNAQRAIAALQHGKGGGE